MDDDFGNTLSRVLTDKVAVVSYTCVMYLLV